MRIVAVLVAMAFAVTLAIVIANRLSNEAMAVIVGAVCGISATIPISLGFAIAAARSWGDRSTSRENGATGRYSANSPYGGYGPYGASEPPRAPQPPVIVIAPPQQAYPYPFAGSSYYMPASPQDAELRGREFKIVGDE